MTLPSPPSGHRWHWQEMINSHQLWWSFASGHSWTHEDSRNLTQRTGVPSRCKDSKTTSPETDCRVGGQGLLRALEVSCGLHSRLSSGSSAHSLAESRAWFLLCWQSSSSAMRGLGHFRTCTRYLPIVLSQTPEHLSGISISMETDMILHGIL